jgi:hypothetical protein
MSPPNIFKAFQVLLANCYMDTVRWRRSGCKPAARVEPNPNGTTTIG